MTIDEDRLARLPGTLRPSAALWLQRLEETHAGASLPAGFEDQLLRVVAVSEFAANALLRDWNYWQGRFERLVAPPDPRELREFAADPGHGDAGIDEVKARLRRLRHRYMLGVLWREVAGTAALEETLEALSELADQMLAAAGRYAERQLEERYGRLKDGNGVQVPLVVLAMGKLGGGELNFSSDIDIVFLYPADGESDGPRKLGGQQYFTRLSQMIVALLDDGRRVRIPYRYAPASFRRQRSTCRQFSSIRVLPAAAWAGLGALCLRQGTHRRTTATARGGGRAVR